MQRKETKPGKSLGKTTGWIHRQSLADKGINMLPGCEYTKITDKGIVIDQGGKEQLLQVDNVILCAGQYSKTELLDELNERYSDVHVIGGAKLASEVDAKRAIDEGVRLAHAI